MCVIVFVISSLFGITKGEYDYKGQFTKNVKNYEIVIPQKISENGGFVSYYLPHYYNVARVRRGADSGKVHYSLPIGGDKRVLELIPSEDFHSPGIVLEHHEGDARVNINSVKFRKPRKLDCYYHGWVRNEPTSSAAISACSGLAGAITINSDHYMIEPVDEDGKPTQNPKHLHMLYKRDHHSALVNLSSCGTKETFETAFEERMKWEAKYGKETERNLMGDDAAHHIVRSFDQTRNKKWCTTCKPRIKDVCHTLGPPCLQERPLFLELALVISPRLAQDKFLSQDMEQYVNTILNIAAKHFQDSSLGRPIQIKLVRVITLGFLYEDLDPFRYTPEDLLKRFCDWQMHFNPSREVHPNHHDFVIYLAKLGDCTGKMQGLTNMASVCRPDKACALVNMQGLLTGHVITHTLGHSLGADHDDENASGCSPEEPDGRCYHMAKHICTRSTAWSTCSRQCISKFIATHAAWCMSDVPTAFDMTDPILLPGQIYSAAEQCRINFEIDTYACLVGEFCKHLFCKVSDTECISTGEPPAQGTKCGPHQWCFNQKCVHKGSRPGATNGEWGIWSPWTTCTKTCGGGIQTSNRACDSPAPTNGGRKCPGAWIKSRMCNVAPCPDAGKGFLDQQCKNTNPRPYHGRRHHWLYFNQQIEDLECAVMCINERSEVAVRSPLALDGTFCKPGAKDVCIRGECKPVGCDWVIGSKSKEDACGVCHGNGTECRVMQGYFTEQNFKGKIPFLKLPIGTSMILLRETRPSPCVLTIANSLNSSYYLNSDDAEEGEYFTGAFSIQSTVGIYQLKAHMERIFIKEPLKVPITVSVICKHVERFVGVLYQYALPEPINPNGKPHYTWEFLSWDKCPQACGGSIQRARPICVESQGGEVEDSYCSAEARPIDRIRVCNPRPCSAKWWVGPWSECDCYMKDGVTTRMVMCAHMKAARSSHITIVTEDECLGEDKPISEKPCGTEAESTFWAKKGERKRRDYTDLIPYSREVEDYSVWDSVPGDNHETLVNVRETLQALDPEKVDDYRYLKKAGVSSTMWAKIWGEPAFNGRKRRRTAIIHQGRTKPKSAKKEIVHKTGHQSVGTKFESTVQKTLENYSHNKTHSQLLKENHNKLSEVQKKEHNDSERPKVLKNEQVKRNESKKKQANTKKKPKSGMKGTTEKNDNVDKKIKKISAQKENSSKQYSRVAVDTSTESRHKPLEHTTESEVTPSKKAQETTKVRLMDSTLKYQTRSHETKGYKAATYDSSTSGTTEKVRSQMKTTKQFSRASVEEIGSNGNIVVLKGDPNKMKKAFVINIKTPHTEKSAKEFAKRAKALKKQTPAYVKTRLQAQAIEEDTTAEISSETYSTMLGTAETTESTDEPTALTAPEVKIAPGLKPYTMLLSETIDANAGTQACQRMEIKTPRGYICIPQDQQGVQPADEQPEWDFINTSNVKIFVVPIQTTLRTIIQNDNEFVLMETLAKYPVADEMQIVEHSGDEAKKKLKLAVDKRKKKFDSKPQTDE